VEGNEKADALAKATVQLPPTGHQLTSLTHLLRVIKADHDNRWEKSWKETPPELKGKHYVGDWKRNPDSLFKEDRIICSTVTQLRTGHGHFGSFLCRMGFRDSERCIWQNGPRETPQHLSFTALGMLRLIRKPPNDAEYPSIKVDEFQVIRGVILLAGSLTKL
jgi:hypothetical protein